MIRDESGWGPWARRTVGELRAAVATGNAVKTELQLYGIDWSQLDGESDDAVLADVFVRHGAVPLSPAAIDPTGGSGRTSA